MSDSATLLIVDDETPIRRFLRAGLSGGEYNLVEAINGKEALQHVATYNPDLVLLDLGLPDIDGIEIVRQIREWSEVPIIVLSARGREEDKISALDTGANDYLVKPFLIGELKARVRAALRARAIRTGENENPVVQVGALTIDLAARRVLKGDQEVHLTPKEFRLLSIMARHIGKVLTHNYLLTEVWGKAYAEQTQYLRVFMKQLREKLESDPARPQHITTETGVGYRFLE